MPDLAITTAVLGSPSPLITRCLESWGSGPYEFQVRHNTTEDNLGVTGSLQWLHENTKAPIIAFLHSDCEIMEEGWAEAVLREFEDEKVGVVGFGGALQLGADEIYKIPYELHQLRRLGYMSNQSDAEEHGERFTHERDVATLDGFALIVRRKLLDKWGGWPVERYKFHNYDNVLCLEAAKQGYRVRLVGAKCQHHGGQTSTSPAGLEHWLIQGTSDHEVHTKSHLALYEDGRGWLPLRVRL